MSVHRVKCNNEACSNRFSNRVRHEIPRQWPTVLGGQWPDDSSFYELSRTTTTTTMEWKYFARSHFFTLSTDESSHLTRELQLVCGFGWSGTLEKWRFFSGIFPWWFENFGKKKLSNRTRTHKIGSLARHLAVLRQTTLDGRSQRVHLHSKTRYRPRRHVSCVVRRAAQCTIQRKEREKGAVLSRKLGLLNLAPAAMIVIVRWLGAR